MWEISYLSICTKVANHWGKGKNPYLLYRLLRTTRRGRTKRLLLRLHKSQSWQTTRNCVTQGDTVCHTIHHHDTLVFLQDGRAQCTWCDVLLLYSVQPCTRTPTFTFPCPIFIPKDPHFISITFLFPILTLTLWSVFETPYTQPWPPSPFPTQSPSTPTEDSVIPSWTYSCLCCARDPV